MQEMWETRVRSLGQEDPQEEETATHSHILAWRIPRTEEPGRLQSRAIPPNVPLSTSVSGTSWEIQVRALGGRETQSEAWLRGFPPRQEAGQIRGIVDGQRGWLLGGDPG